MTSETEAAPITSPSWQELLATAKDEFSRADVDGCERSLNLALMQAHQNNAPEGAVADIFFNMGLCAVYRHDFDNAEKRFKQALRTAERTFGSDSPDAVAVRSQLVALYQQAGQFEKAKALSLVSESPAVVEKQLPVNTLRKTVMETRMPEALAPAALPEPAPAFAPALPTLPDPTSASVQTNVVIDRPLPPAQSPLNSVTDKPVQRSAPASASTAPQAPPHDVAAKHIYQETQSRTSDYAEQVASARSFESDEPLDVDSLIHPREKFYGKLSAFVSCWIYLCLLLCLVGIVLAPLAYLFTYLLSCVHHGQLRANGVRISDEQFPEVFEAAEELCSRLRMPVPEMFVIQEHGLLNAYAKRAHHRDIIVIYSNVFEMAYECGINEMKFILAHELTHVKRQHVKMSWLRTPAHWIPFLGHAYSRACEYTCDRVAIQLVPEGAMYGLVALASGTKLYKQVNLEALREQQPKDWDFWTWYAEVISTHPNLVNRIAAVGLRMGSFESHDAVQRSSPFPRRRR